MKLAIIKSKHLDDWWLIERAEHDGRHWLQSTAYGMAFMSSSRIGNADVEGSGGEMLAIAEAIVARKDESFTRCAVRFDGERVFFRSPRNTSEEGEPCTLAEADELAAAIKAAVGAA